MFFESLLKFTELAGPTCQLCFNSSDRGLWFLQETDKALVGLVDVAKHVGSRQYVGKA